MHLCCQFVFCFLNLEFSRSRSEILSLISFKLEFSLSSLETLSPVSLNLAEEEPILWILCTHPFKDLHNQLLPGTVFNAISFDKWPAQDQTACRSFFGSGVHCLSWAGTSILTVLRILPILGAPQRMKPLTCMIPFLSVCTAKTKPSCNDDRKLSCSAALHFTVLPILPIWELPSG